MTAFPGGTSVTRLSVYTGRCADDLRGGTPHVHTVSTEAYVVTGGSGELHTLDASGFRVTPVRAGSTVWFGPGVVHRAVNQGGLEVVVVMANAGLPEAGDAVMTFPPDVVADPARYQAAADAGPDGAAVEGRRDLAVDGFNRMAAAMRAGDPGPLHAFYGAAVALVRPRVERWRAIWEATVRADVDHTAAALDALDRGDSRHLLEAGLFEAPVSDTAGWGMCGRLRTHDVRSPIVHRETAGD